MTVAGIIAEYNPFHNGHARLTAAARAQGATHIVAVLGGNFTQRGEPALLPLTDRVRMALAGGADLVIELPLPWAVSSAETFAQGGVFLLDRMGCVDQLIFGCEAGKLPPLDAVVAALRSREYPAALRRALQQGLSYAAAQQRAVAERTDEKTALLLEKPNNALAVAYHLALQNLDSRIQPVPIRRSGAAHDQKIPAGDTASAAYIRAQIQKGALEQVVAFLPPASADILREAIAAGRCLTNPALSDRLMLHTLRGMTLPDIAALPGISEGLENRLFAAVRREQSLNDVIKAVRTRRYPAARLQRIVAAAYIGLPAGWERRTPPYLRVLGLNAKGAQLLHCMKTTAQLPVFTDPQQPPPDRFSDQLFAFTCKASDLYGSMLPTPLPCGQEYTAGMQRL